MSLKDIVQRLYAQSGMEPMKSAGQHFLIDATVLESAIRAARVTADDHVVEIGAGPGILTKALLATGCRVTTIEWDRRWIPVLRSYIDADSIPDDRLTIINANALTVPLPQTPHKIVANIPYHITAPLLKYAFASDNRPPVSATLLIQKEVAEKLAADPPASYLSVLVGLAGTTTIVRMVPPGAFLPPPAVDSAVIHIDAHNPPLVDKQTREKALELASAAFRGKRKMLRVTLGEFHGGAERLARAGIAEDRRPGTLSIAEWIALAQA